MESNFITLTAENIAAEHICCAFSDKKCREGYELKKRWLEKEFPNGHVFRRLNARAKVFIEYSPAETAWVPVEAPGYLLLNCFWVSGQCKQKGYGKALLGSVLDDARRQGKIGIATVTGTSKLNFLSDGKWLLRQGFREVGRLPYGFSLLALQLEQGAKSPRFMESALTGECPEKNGLVAYYSNRCPFAEYHVQHTLLESAGTKNVPLKVIRLETMEQAQAAPSPATIFSLFHQGRFVTADLSACAGKKFDSILETRASGK